MFLYGSVPKWSKGADCKFVVTDFNGSNPFAPTKDHIEIPFRLTKGTVLRPDKQS